MSGCWGCTLKHDHAGQRIHGIDRHQGALDQGGAHYSLVPDVMPGDRREQGVNRGSMARRLDSGPCAGIDVRSGVDLAAQCVLGQQECQSLAAARAPRGSAASLGMPSSTRESICSRSLAAGSVMG